MQHSKWYYIYRNVPLETLYDKILDESLAVADYKLPIVSTDIPMYNKKNHYVKLC